MRILRIWIPNTGYDEGLNSLSDFLSCFLLSSQERDLLAAKVSPRGVFFTTVLKTKRKLR
jgi:hypothetical protein